MALGKFITIEGVEGVGKSTAIAVICEILKKSNLEYVLTREPGGTPVGEAIRQVLLVEHGEIVMPLTEALLFFAGRLQNITHIISPALQQGKWVISDRFTDSSFAYQGAGRGVSQDQLLTLASWVQKDLTPSLTILLDAPVEIGLARIQKRNHQDRIETETVSFFDRVRAHYLTLAHTDPKRYRIVKADDPIEVVQQRIACIMQEVIAA